MWPPCAAAHRGRRRRADAAGKRSPGVVQDALFQCRRRRIDHVRQRRPLHRVVRPSFGDRRIAQAFSGIDGVHDAQILSADATAGEIRLGMIDVPRVEKFPDHYFLDTGSPHHVEFVPDVRREDVARKGAMIRRSDPYAAAGGTNVNFVEIVSDGRIRVRTYERGVEAETLACRNRGHGFGAGGCRAIRERLPELPGRRRGRSPFRVFRTDRRRAFYECDAYRPGAKVFEGCLAEKF